MLSLLRAARLRIPQLSNSWRSFSASGGAALFWIGVAAIDGDLVDGGPERGT
jgi:hypothetical protein